MNIYLFLKKRYTCFIFEEMLKIYDEMKKGKLYYDRMLNILTEEIIIKLLRGMNEEIEQKEKTFKRLLEGF